MKADTRISYRAGTYVSMILLILSVWLVYWPALEFGFLIGWDDQWFVTNKYTEGGVTPNNLQAILTNFHYGQYAPINQLYYTGLYSIFGYNTEVFHFGGVMLHTLNVLLTFFFIRTILTKVGVTFCENTTRLVPLGTAMLFAVLPFNVEPVAWVSASKVVLYALFYLLALTTYCRYLSSNEARWYYLSLVFFILSFGAKEQAVTLPLAMLLLDYFWGRHMESKVVWMEKAPFVVLALLFGLVTIDSQGIADGERLFYPVYQRIPLATYTVVEYFTKTILPVNLSYLYPFPFLQGEPVPTYLWLHLAVTLVAVSCLIGYLRIRWLLFALLFFLIHILLVCNFLPLARFSIVADRYAYVSNIGVCFLTTCVFLRWYSNVGSNWRWIPTALYAVYFICLSIYSSQHIQVWHNAYTVKKRLKETIEQRADFNQRKDENKDNNETK